MDNFLVRLSNLAWNARGTLAAFALSRAFVHEAGAGITNVNALAIKKS